MRITIVIDKEDVDSLKRTIKEGLLYHGLLARKATTAESHALHSGQIKLLLAIRKGLKEAMKPGEPWGGQLP